MQTYSSSIPENRATTPADADAAARVSSVLLDPAFLVLADEFGMIPERMAERVLSAFAATPPSHLIVKGRRFAARSSR